MGAFLSGSLVSTSRSTSFLTHSLYALCTHSVLTSLPIIHSVTSFLTPHVGEDGRIMDPWNLRSLKVKVNHYPLGLPR